MRRILLLALAMAASLVLYARLLGSTADYTATNAGHASRSSLHTGYSVRGGPRSAAPRSSHLQGAETDAGRQLDQAADGSGGGPGGVAGSDYSSSPSSFLPATADTSGGSAVGTGRSETPGVGAARAGAAPIASSSTGILPAAALLPAAAESRPPAAAAAMDPLPVVPSASPTGTPVRPVGETDGIEKGVKGAQSQGQGQQVQSQGQGQQVQSQGQGQQVQSQGQGQQVQGQGQGQQVQGQATLSQPQPQEALSSPAAAAAAAANAGAGTSDSLPGLGLGPVSPGVNGASAEHAAGAAVPTAEELFPGPAVTEPCVRGTALHPAVLAARRAASATADLESQPQTALLYPLGAAALTGRNAVDVKQHSVLETWGLHPLPRSPLTGRSKANAAAAATPAETASVKATPWREGAVEVRTDLGSSKDAFSPLPAGYSKPLRSEEDVVNRLHMHRQCLDLEGPRGRAMKAASGGRVDLPAQPVTVMLSDRGTLASHGFAVNKAIRQWLQTTAEKYGLQFASKEGTEPLPYGFPTAKAAFYKGPWIEDHWLATFARPVRVTIPWADYQSMKRGEALGADDVHPLDLNTGLPLSNDKHDQAVPRSAGEGPLPPSFNSSTTAASSGSTASGAAEAASTASGAAEAASTSRDTSRDWPGDARYPKGLPVIDVQLPYDHELFHPWVPLFLPYMNLMTFLVDADSEAERKRQKVRAAAADAVLHSGSTASASTSTPTGTASTIPATTIFDYAPGQEPQPMPKLTAADFSAAALIARGEWTGSLPTLGPHSAEYQTDDDKKGAGSGSSGAGSSAAGARQLRGDASGDGTDQSQPAPQRRRLEEDKTDGQPSMKQSLCSLVQELSAIMRPDVQYVTLAQRAGGPWLFEYRWANPCARALYTILQNTLVISAGGVGHVPIPLLGQERPFLQCSADAHTAVTAREALMGSANAGRSGGAGSRGSGSSSGGAPPPLSYDMSFIGSPRQGARETALKIARASSWSTFASDDDLLQKGLVDTAGATGEGKMSRALMKGWGVPAPAVPPGTPGSSNGGGWSTGSNSGAGAHHGGASGGSGSNDSSGGRKVLSIRDTAEHLWMRAMAGGAFQLAPRGTGPTSFRLYEALQMGLVPVYMHDGAPWLPYLKPDQDPEWVDGQPREKQSLWAKIAVVKSVNSFNTWLKDDLNGAGGVSASSSLAAVLGPEGDPALLDKMKLEAAAVRDRYFTYDGVVRRVAEWLDDPFSAELSCYPSSFI